MQSSAHRFAIRIGGLVTIATFGVITQTPVDCACGSPAPLDHMLWQRPLVPRAARICSDSGSRL